MTRRTITEQQKVFVDKYLANRKKNATQSAIEAGYSKKTASSQASQLLNNPKVTEYLEKRENEMQQVLRREFFYDALEARNVMYEIMNDPSAMERDRITVAKYFLEVAGYKAVDKVEHSGEMTTNVNHMQNLSEEELRKLAQLDGD